MIKRLANQRRNPQTLSPWPFGQSTDQQEVAKRLTAITFGSSQGQAGITSEIGSQEGGSFRQGQVQI